MRLQKRLEALLISNSWIFMKKLKLLNITNTVIRLFFFFAFPAAWATGFSGVKYLCEQIHSGKPIEMNAFLAAFIALALFTIIFGRFFCGRACAFGTYGEILHEAAKLIAKKTHHKLPRVSEHAAGYLRYVKYVVLIVICILCVLGYGSAVSGGSPWTAFSHIRTGSLSLGSSADIIGLVIFALCTIGMVFIERFFCRFLCPFGAVFSLLPVLPLSAVSRCKSRCIRGCKACKNICPAGLDLPYNDIKKGEPFTEDEREYALHMGECFQCGKCAHMCPAGNAGSRLLRAGRIGIFMDVFKAVLLAALLYVFI